jgi:hypothetical protein
MIQGISEFENWSGGFPGEHEYSELSGLEPTPEMDVFIEAAKQVLHNWQGNKFAGMYLYGTPGTGKTHAAIGLGRALHDSGADVGYRYLPDTDLIDQVGKSVSGWTTSRTRPHFKDESFRSIFAQVYAPQVERNPKSVLILDDFQPKYQEYAAAAIEAGAQYGGLVVVTSNHPDPFRLLDSPDAAASTPNEILANDAAQHLAPEIYANMQRAKDAKRAEFTESLRSRIAAGFKFIEFTGPDRRISNSFWG